MSSGTADRPAVSPPAPPADHDHAHGLRGTPERRILLALVLTVITMVASIAGGIVSHSLALLSDAGHMLADAAALGLALVAQRVASRRARTGGPTARGGRRSWPRS